MPRTWRPSTLLLVVVVGLWAAQAAAQSHSLTTTFTGSVGVGQVGSHVEMFDITTDTHAVSITAFDCHLHATTSSMVVVYYKAGSWVGHATNPTAWTYGGHFFVQGAGQNQPTHVALTTPITIPVAETYGIALGYSQPGGFQSQFIAPLTFSDSFITLTPGATTDGPFTYAPGSSLWNGTVCYDALGDLPPSLEPAANSPFVDLGAMKRRVKVPVGSALTNASLVADDLSSATISVSVTSTSAAPGVTAPATQSAAVVPAVLSWTGTCNVPGTYAYTVTLGDGTNTVSYFVTLVVLPVQDVPYYCYYKFNEGAGATTANDASPGAGNNPVAFYPGYPPPVWSTPGTPGGSFLGFTGSAIPLDTGWAAEFREFDSWTVESWIRLPSGGWNGSGSLFFFGLPHGSGLYAWYEQGAILFSTDHASQGTTIRLNAAVYKDTWYHLALAYDGANQNLNLYWNGALNAEKTGPIRAAYTGQLIIGSFTFFDLQLDEFRVWEGARTQAEILTGMNHELPLPDSTMLTQVARTPAFYPPATDVVVLDMYASTFVGNNSLDSITLTQTGTAPVSEIAGISLIRDNNDDGIFDAADTVLGTGTLTSGTVTFSGSPLIALTVGAPVRLLLAVTTAASYTVNNSIQFEVSGAGWSGGTDLTMYPITGPSCSTTVTRQLGALGGPRNSIPFNNNSSHRFQTAYSAAEINLGSGYEITEIRVSGSLVSPPTFGNLRVRLGHTTLGVNALTTDFDLNYAGNLQTCLGPVNFTPSASGGWYSFPLTSPFRYNGVDGVVVDWSFDSRSGPGFNISDAPGRSRVFEPGGSATSASGTLADGGNYGIRFNFDLAAPLHLIAGATGGTGAVTSPYTAAYTETMGPAAGIDLAYVAAPISGQSLTIASVSPGASNPAGGAGFHFTLTSATGGFLNVAPGGVLVAADIGLHEFDVRITNGLMVAAVSVAITVAASPVITTPATLPNGEQGVPFALTIGVTGGSAPVILSVTAGNLPPGLTLMPTGNLGGTPTATGAFSFDATAMDVNGISATTSFFLDIDPPAAGFPAIITVSPLIPGVVNHLYGPAYMQVSGGTTPFSFALVSGALPTGLSLTPTGVISGRPAASGVFNFEIEVSDAAFASDTKAFEISIKGIPGGQADNEEQDGHGCAMRRADASPWAMLIALAACLGVRARCRIIRAR